MSEAEAIDARRRAVVSEACIRARTPATVLIAVGLLWAIGAVALYLMAKVQGSQLLALVAIGAMGPAALVGMGGWLLRRLRGWNVVWAGLLIGIALWGFVLVLAVLEQVQGPSWIGAPLAITGIVALVWMARFGEDGHIREARTLVSPRTGPVDPVDRMPF